MSSLFLWICFLEILHPAFAFDVRNQWGIVWPWVSLVSILFFLLLSKLVYMIVYNNKLRKAISNYQKEIWEMEQLLENSRICRDKILNNIFLENLLQTISRTTMQNRPPILTQIENARVSMMTVEKIETDAKFAKSIDTYMRLKKARELAKSKSSTSNEKMDGGGGSDKKSVLLDSNQVIKDES
uniref:Uncharacterized protein n=1 Tax=Acrobeloides nanus TaxID=290746 RepID=A0A914CFM6_9BILA